MTYVLNKRYCIKEISSDGLIKTPKSLIEYGGGALENTFDEYRGYSSREEAYEAIKTDLLEYDKKINSNYQHSSPDYMIIEVINYDWED